VRTTAEDCLQFARLDALRGVSQSAAQHSVYQGDGMARRKRGYKKWIVIILLVLVFVGYLLIDNAVRPAILSLTEARLSAIGVRAMNEAVQETIGDGGIVYTDLINIQKDNEGNITLMSVNMALMNSLAAQTANCAQDKILNIGEQGISIPIGTIIGGQLLTGRGPAVNVRIEPVGSVITKFGSEFKEAGINQTRHKIYIVLTATVRIVVGNTSQSVDITTQVLISETIIVGEVPQNYFQGTQNELLHLLPSADD
jgi:sporulation protein YunB